MARYRIEHETRYAYDTPVSESWQVARLTPRALPWQRVLWHRLVIDPSPDESDKRTDAYGNEVTHFALHRAHPALRAHMTCAVEVGARPDWRARADAQGDEAEPWEAVRDSLLRPGQLPDLAPAQAREASELLLWSAAAHAYAAPSLTPGRDWLAAVSDLMARIHADFTFRRGVTGVRTPVEVVLDRREGVCQDFAHLMIACLRAHGLPARYMSGYLLTRPPPGQARLAGADASHAWVAAWSRCHGWVEFDPTNDTLADERFVVLGWGGDFADVAPLHGVVLGGGEQRLTVRVSVWPMQGDEVQDPAARGPLANA